MNDLQLRPTVRADIPKIQNLVDTIYRDYGAWLDLDDEPHWIDPGTYFHERGGEFWVLMRGDALVATVAVKLSNGSTAELKCLYVHRSLRRLGWATKLVRLAEGFARNVGRTKMVLWSDVRFVEAHRLYEKLGYRRTGFRELLDSQDTKEHGYERELEAGATQS